MTVKTIKYKSFLAVSEIVNHLYTIYIKVDLKLDALRYSN